MYQFQQIGWIALLSATLLIPGTPAAMRWGPLGHRIVGDVAESRLSPAVEAESRRLLGGQSLGDVGSWADEHRTDLGPTFSPWHYVDIEIMDTGYVAARDCKADACIIAALTSQVTILGDRSRPDSARAVALKWVVHLVGDLHQPLHSGERGDRGGNDIKLIFNGQPSNLHSVWDSGILASLGQSEGELVAGINADIASRADIADIAAGSIVQWVMQSHDLARDAVYRNLPDNHEITPAYVAAATPVIRLQLLRAGVRLAALVERTLKH